MTNIFDQIRKGVEKSDKAAHMAARSKRQVSKLRKATKQGKVKKVAKLTHKLAKTGYKFKSNVKGATKMGAKVGRKSATAAAQAAMFVV